MANCERCPFVLACDSANEAISESLMSLQNKSFNLLDDADLHTGESSDTRRFMSKKRADLIETLDARSQEVSKIQEMYIAQCAKGPKTRLLGKTVCRSSQFRNADQSRVESMSVWAHNLDALGE